ncbi:MAG: helix-turn-helix domain-containing protein [Firmicutes bacterium]|nr:helix-turn-helix domain-containing protein [Bacillota bacterium]
MENTVGGRVKWLRTTKGISQKGMANILGIDKANYGRYEKNIFAFKHEMLVTLAKYFDVTTDFILGLEDYAGNKINISIDNTQ